MSKARGDKKQINEKLGCRFVSNRECEYFPCHDMDSEDDFNCLFCYCPLYALGAGCGGDFKYTDGGIKDCSDCLIPHGRDAYERIAARLRDVAAIAGRNRGAKR